MDLQQQKKNGVLWSGGEKDNRQVIQRERLDRSTSQQEKGPLKLKSRGGRPRVASLPQKLLKCEEQTSSQGENAVENCGDLELSNSPVRGVEPERGERRIKSKG